MITEIPILKIAAKDQARRFISLIDALYESRCRIVCQAESEPSQLFFPDAVASATIGTGVHGTADIDVMMAEAVGGTREIYRPNVSSYDAPNMAEAPSIHVSPLTLETLSIFSGMYHGIFPSLRSEYHYPCILGRETLTDQSCSRG